MPYAHIDLIMGWNPFSLSVRNFERKVLFLHTIVKKITEHYKKISCCLPL